MDKEIQNKRIEQYLEESEAEFDRILEEGERKRHGKMVRWTSLAVVAAAACIGLVLWLAPIRPDTGNQLTPVQIAEGIQQMMLLDIGEIDSIVATPADSYAILTAHLKDGNTCSFILKCNGEDGTTSLFAYTNNQYNN